MADDKSDKTEPATPKRRNEARESGHMPKSQDLTSAVLLVVGLLVLSYTARTFVFSLSDILRTLLGTGNGQFATANQMFDNALRISAPQMFKILAPLLITVAVAAFLTTGIQVGFHINLKPIMPNLAKLNPVQGLGRMFAGQQWMQLAMNLVKLVIIAAIAWNEINAQFPVILSLYAVDFPQNFTMAAEIIYNLAWRIAMALLILAAVDWIYHKWKFEKDIRMSKQEIKDESKNQEGDQAIKGRRRQLAQMILQRIHRDVPTADVIVTNPTELAIAIRYDPDTMAAPKVVAKGAGFLAQRIRQIAVSNGVPIIERKPLAQALYKTIEVGHDVPPEFYQTLAEILAYVYELSGKGIRKPQRELQRESEPVA